MKRVIANVRPGSYRQSPLHNAERRWAETNCYVDLFIEIMHATGHDPVATLGFTVAQDFEGDQFTFFKFALEDMRRLAGFDVQELSLFDRLEGHITAQIERGRLPLVEVDSYSLPDTQGITYGISHTKTTIGINALDPAGKRLEYFHNAGLFALDGDDYDAIFHPEETAKGLPLFPYAEFVKFEPPEVLENLPAAACDILKRHLLRRPKENPFKAYQNAFASHAEDLGTRSPDYFHTYAFGTLRQIGANYELLSDHLQWLSQHGEQGLAEATEACLRISDVAKAMQFKLARAMARKRFDGLSESIDLMTQDYGIVMQALDSWAVA
ncbi:DUF1839 family protein [Cohaesibacter celericrescens]|uniref:DUF1839 domain-containing protein n=1 Tax=Cohaesibacter celericrescens TaxID=2067669 RepID=A0A2N5XMH2_9HYPH|nr:DUF1839 family protein [Cohaesibacter celericrescens]PLW75709.1 DUF1839 domain-containing protein [Cohaesibacter celericrescens]